MTKKMKFWQTQKTMIEDLVVRGVNVREIAKSYKVTFQNMYTVCSKLDIDIQMYKAKRASDKALARAKAKEIEAQQNKEYRKIWFLNYWADLHGKKPRKTRSHNQPTVGVSKTVLDARRRTQEYSKNNKLKLLCRRVCLRALKMGYITKEVCSECGTSNHIECHHPDYYHPFQIVWVCKKHHHELYHSGASWHKTKIVV